jgi:hypothetical protein
MPNVGTDEDFARYEKSKGLRRKLRDPDDAPEITQEWVDRANLYRGKKLVRRGRPPAAVRKVSKSAARIRKSARSKRR